VLYECMCACAWLRSSSCPSIASIASMRLTHRPCMRVRVRMRVCVRVFARLPLHAFLHVVCSYLGAAMTPSPSMMTHACMDALPAQPAMGKEKTCDHGFGDDEDVALGREE
jgi:hypothetical protein